MTIDNDMEPVKGPYYADWDQKVKLFCVYGPDKDRRYSCHKSMIAAEKDANQRNDTHVY
jgi:hypothetical protein